MASAEPDLQPTTEPNSLPAEAEQAFVLEDPLPEPALHEQASQTEEPPSPCRPLRIYTRSQMLFLHGSPLVKPPPDMPELKHWFGEQEQNGNKKDSEPSTPNSARERRFRRDPEDGETSTRPTFRSGLSQPSQMGNFKHQSLRANDRDRDRERDRDGDKDRDRDIRDKEGQERLRNLSDKYDRDRLVSPTNIRNKEKDIAPHLAIDSAGRLASQSQPSGASRRAETRETSKKKVGEVSDDWRRGADPRHPGRPERSDNSRTDRDRPRSRVRDSSRPRRETSASRRERDRDADERDLDRDRRDRDDHRNKPRDELRRPRDEHRRDREREGDKDESNDPRRWRDDGKRDERMAARRTERVDGEHRDKDRARDRPREEAWDPSGERRWTVVEERDGRSKRNAGRDRRAGAAGEDRDERRDREREKEKEPAWMDTYVPTSSSTGILGGQNADGELDGIQAWKKGMKEKEQKEKASSNQSQEKVDGAGNAVSDKADPSATQLDEIQQFKLLMKQAEEQKKEKPKSDGSPPPIPVIDSALPGPIKIQRKVSSGNQAAPDAKAHEADSQEVPPSTVAKASLPLSSEAPSPGTVADVQSLLSILGSKQRSKVHPQTNPPPLDPSLDRHDAKSSSRVFLTPVAHENPTQSLDKTPLDPISGTPFNPPSGSRLLAFGARNAALKSQPANISSTGGSTPNGSHPHPVSNPAGVSQHMGPIPHDNHQSGASLKSDSHRAPTGFSPFENQSRPSYGFEDHQESGNLVNGPDFRRASAERPPSNLSSESGPYPDSVPSDTSNYAQGRGSRMAKFFDEKRRDGPPTKVPNPIGFLSSSPNPGQRRDGSFNSTPGSTEHRATDDLFTMLNNSAQAHRTNLTPMISPNTAPAINNVSFSQQAQNNLHLLQQQQQLQSLHHVQQNGRLEPLYESRLDDRSFMPDGMVPGLRSALPPRGNRDGVFPDSLEDSMHFNPPRLPIQRGLDPMYPGPINSVYGQQAGRNSTMSVQQPHYRGGPSPISNPNSLPNPPQQRLPPGLANLGGRPPHEPSQFIGMPGLPSGGLHGLHVNGPLQQQQQQQASFNNFAPGGNMAFGNGLQPQMRGPLPGAHQLQAPLQHHQMGGIGHPNNIDLRGPSQAQLLNLGLGGGGRVGGGFGPQQVPHGQMQGQMLGVRQQQQQQPQQAQLPPHMMPHGLAPHLQQQGIPALNNQTQDLMQLLMGTHNRE